MRIKKIRLTNGYKRFYDLTIDLGDAPKRIVALVGPNGCGKSSIIDGIIFHKSGRYGHIGGYGIQDYKYHSRGDTIYNPEDIKIDFVEGDFESIHRKKQATNNHNTILSFRSPNRIHHYMRIRSSSAVSAIKDNAYGATFSIDLDSKMEENYRRLYTYYNRYVYKQNCRPSDASDKILSDLNRSIRNCLDMEISSLGSIDDDKGTLYFSKPDHLEEFEFNVLSSGEKEVVDILLDLYLRREDYNDTVFLIDEPELHINTAIQRPFLIEINRLIGENCQLWIATHSIGFLRALQEELRDECQIIQFKQGIKWASEPQILTPVAKTHAMWREVFDVALDDLVGLVSPRRLVYCEGRGEPGRVGQEQGLDARVYNAIFAEKYPDTLFISSGGNTELDQRSDIALTILTKALSGVEILVLKDRDMASGKPTTEADRQVYLTNNPKNHRVLKRWEIENYLFDKTVLAKYCQHNNLPFNEEKYDAEVSDISNHSIKDMIGRIRSICGITTSINADQFKLNLAQYITEDMDIYSELEMCVFMRQ